MAQDTLTVKEKLLPGRKVYVPVDDIKHEAWRHMTSKDSISRENFERLKKLGVKFQIQNADEDDHQSKPIDTLT